MRKIVVGTFAVLAVATIATACNITDGDNSPVVNGKDGANGKSAYELYCEIYPDYTGTLEEWLESLKGESGVSIEKVEYDENGDLLITFTNGTTQTVATPQKTAGESLSFQKITGKEEYRVVGLGTVSSVEIEIPATYNGLPVTEIGAFAFSSNKNYACAYLERIEIPDGVTMIGEYAFENCYELSEIIIPNSVTEISTFAFSFCDSLTEFIIPNGVIKIGEGVFYGCFGLTSVVISSSVREIGDRAFASCRGLTEIVIPATVETIELDVFADCRLTVYCEAKTKPNGWWEMWSFCPVVWDYKNNEVANDGYIYKIIDGIRYGLKDGVAKVARQAHQIVTANIPNTVSYKGATYTVSQMDIYAFNQCRSLIKAVIPNGITEIADYAFEDCFALCEISLPNSLATIGIFAFSGCRDLTEIVIPDSVSFIGYSAFQDCDSLTQIIIPDSVTEIDSYAFAYCDNLTIYCEAESQPSSWTDSWNVDNRPVEWGYKGE